MNQSSSPLPEVPALGYLSDVSQEHRAFLASFGKFLRPQSGEEIITEGKAQDSLYLILSGTVHVVSSSGERPLLLASLGEGDSLGEINLFDPGIASASVIARADCLLWVITHKELDDIVDADSVVGVEVMKGLLCQLSKRVRQMNSKLTTSEQKATFHDFWSVESK